MASKEKENNLASEEPAGKINLSKNKDYNISKLDLNEPQVLDRIELNKKDKGFCSRCFPSNAKVITLLCSIGILGMIAAKYTPIFDIIGYAFYPFTKLLGVPDPMVAAVALPTGITEMFIPVLTIADQVAQLHIKTRFFVTAVSMVQIIFLAESVVVIMNTGLPVKFREMLYIFVQRTLIAMPFVALFMHLLF